MFNQNLVINGKKLIFIERKADFITAMQELAKSKSFAIDTEFDRNRSRYGFNVCVIQIATEKNCYIIDPLAVAQGERMNTALKPLWELIESDKHLKIIHALGEDIRLFAKYNCVARCFFDTKIAAETLCIKGGDSFKTLLKAILDKEVDKSLQKTNWFERPLTWEHLLYLANDVVYLQQIKDELEKQLKTAQREHWFAEEMEFALQLEAHINHDAEIQSLKNKQEYRMFSEFQQFMFEKLWHLRDQTAQKADKPPFYIFGNEQLFKIAENATDFIQNPIFKGFYKTFQEEEKQQVFLTQLQNWLTEAQTLNLATVWQKPKFDPNKPFVDRTKAKEIALRTFNPIKDFLREKYGEDTEKRLLSNRKIEIIGIEQNLNLLPQYIVAEIKAAAQATNTDISKYLK